MLNKIVSIVRIFPDYEEKIDFLFQTDENFRDLCLDHILCSSMILDMRNTPNKHTAEIEEYEEVQRNLEEEILEMISKDNNKQ